MKTTMCFWLITILLLFTMCKSSTKNENDCTSDEKYNVPTGQINYVFETTNLKRYSFPTHINDLVVDRAQSSVSEVFMVIVEPGKSVHHHMHTDTEQIFYMIEGTGILSIGSDKVEYPVKPGDVIRIPLSTLHSIRTDSDTAIKYLCVDCFAGTPLETTWEQHVKVVCDQKGWDYNEVIN